VASKRLIGSAGKAALLNSRGVTIIEVLIAALLSTVAIVAAFTTYAGTMHSWEGTACLTDVQREASLALEVMAREIRSGSSVAIGAGSNSISVYYDTESGDSLMATFVANGNNELIDIGGGIVTSHVSSVSFSSPDGQAVNIDILIENDRGTTTTGDDQHVLMSSTAVCRN
jgi:hypothetical protein